MMTTKQKQYLRGLAHGLKPVVQVGNKGMQDVLVDQVERQLELHELIKIRFNTQSAVEPEAAMAELALRTQSELVQRVGRMVVLYRRHATEPKIELPS